MKSTKISIVLTPPMFQNYKGLTSETLVFNKYQSIVTQKEEWKSYDWGGLVFEKQDIKQLFNSPYSCLSNYNMTNTDSQTQKIQRGKLVGNKVRK